ncbi:MAG TPA: ParB/RepB/Spo0J family partition protein [Caulobacteraceae bacterium]
MTEIRRGLGRGLSALLEEAQGASTPEARRAAGALEIPIELIARNPGQPRRAFDPEQMDELTASIIERGVLQPILVRPVAQSDGQYQIVAGERRWRAALQAGLKAIPALVRDLDDLAVMEISLIENIQRADLNAIEEARGYEAMIARFSRPQEAIASIVGKSRSHVANTLRLLRLPEPVREHLEAGRITAGHARALLGADQAVEFAAQTIARGLSVRQTEALVRRSIEGDASGKPRKRRPAIKDADTRALENDLSDSLGLTVEILHAGGGGELRIGYKSLDQLDEVCRRLMRGAH